MTAKAKNKVQVLLLTTIITLCPILSLINWNIPIIKPAYAESGSMTLDMRGADLRDVLSALAIKMSVNIILIDSTPVDINFKVDNVSPRQALDMLIQSRGLSYIESGGVIVIGQPGTLEKDFFNQMILTRFDTYYILADELQGLISQLGIQGVKSIYIDTNPNIIWAQGTAQGLKKVRELITEVDIPATVEEENKTRFIYTLSYIVAEDAATRLDKYGFGDKLTTIVTEDDRFGKQIMIICTRDIETQVKSVLNSLDAPRQKTKAPILTHTGENSHETLNAARDLLSQLSGVSVANMSISRNMGNKESPKYVLWVEETPDKIKLLKDLVSEADL